MALLVAAVTLVAGPDQSAVGGRTLFKSSGLFRPILVSMVFGLLGGAVNERQPGDRCRARLEPAASARLPGLVVADRAGAASDPAVAAIAFSTSKRRAGGPGSVC